MDKLRERKREPLANAEGHNRFPQRSMDEFNGTSGCNDEVERPDQDKSDRDVGTITEIGRRNPSQRRTSRRDRDGLRDIGSGCQILARRPDEYPCFNCEGGLSFKTCLEIRGKVK